MSTATATRHTVWMAETQQVIDRGLATLEFTKLAYCQVSVETMAENIIEDDQLRQSLANLTTSYMLEAITNAAPDLTKLEFLLAELDNLTLKLQGWTDRDEIYEGAYQGHNTDNEPVFDNQYTEILEIIHKVDSAVKKAPTTNTYKN